MKNKEFTIHQGKQSLVDKLMDARQKMIDQVKNKSHRLEEVHTLNGVTYLNDSSATSIMHAKDSIRCLKDPIIWVLEGTDFDRDFILLNKIAKYKLKAIIAHGSDTNDVKRDLSGAVEHFVQTETLANALFEAKKISSNGDVVLYSPSCPVKGHFANYAERGMAFKKIVKQLK